MPRKRIAWRLGLAGSLAAAAAALALVLTAGGPRHDEWSKSKFAGGDPDAVATSADTPGEGPIGGGGGGPSPGQNDSAQVGSPPGPQNAEEPVKHNSQAGGPPGGKPPEALRPPAH